MSARSHAKRVESTYGITGEQYWSLHEFQGGKCAICQRATGKTRRLSVDHDHATGKVRGLCCRPCNDMLGHLRDEIEAFERGAEYLRTTPAKQFFGDNVPMMAVTDEP